MKSGLVNVTQHYDYPWIHFTLIWLWTQLYFPTSCHLCNREMSCFCGYIPVAYSQMFPFIITQRWYFNTQFLLQNPIITNDYYLIFVLSPSQNVPKSFDIKLQPEIQIWSVCLDNSTVIPVYCVLYHTYPSIVSHNTVHFAFKCWFAFIRNLCWCQFQFSFFL